MAESVDTGSRMISYAQSLRDASALESKFAPEEEPYKFKYEGRAVLVRAKETAEKELEACHSSENTWKLDKVAMICRLQLRRGVNFIDTEENTTGDKTIGQALHQALPCQAQLVGEVRSHATGGSLALRCAVLALATDIIRAAGHRSLILTGWSRPRAALKHLRLAKRVHSEVAELGRSMSSLKAVEKTDSGSRSAHTPEDTRSTHRAGEVSPSVGRARELHLELENAYTHTVFYYAQVYASMQETATASRYVRVTLERQLIGYAFPGDTGRNASPCHKELLPEAGAETEVVAAKVEVEEEVEEEGEGEGEGGGEGVAVGAEDVGVAVAMSGAGADEKQQEDEVTGEGTETDPVEPIGSHVDRLEWARNAVRLCDFYKARRWWQHASRCLDAAACMMNHHREQRIMDVREAGAAGKEAAAAADTEFDVGDRAHRIEAEIHLYRGRMLLELLDTAAQRDVSKAIGQDRLGPAGLNGMPYRRRVRMSVPCPLAEAASSVRSRSDMPLHTADGAVKAAASNNSDEDDDDFDVDIDDSESDDEDEVDGERPTVSEPLPGDNQAEEAEILSSAAGAGASESKLESGDGASPLLLPSQVALPFDNFMRVSVARTESPVVAPTLQPNHPTPSSVQSFAQARAVFKQSNAHLQAALQYFQLDGFVTDYVRIQEDKASLLKYLVGFETTPQRMQAMHLRRVGLQSGLLAVLNPSIFIVNHKELSHQCAMASREAAEIKMQLVDRRFETSRQAPKPTELRNLCGAIDRSIFMHCHFIRCFWDKRLEGASPPVPRCVSMQPHLAAEIMRESQMAKEHPDIGQSGGYTGGSQSEALVGATEIDSGTTLAYLNAAFVTAHLLNKRLDPMAAGRVRDCEDAQAAFQWVADHANPMLTSEGLSTDDDSMGRRAVGEEHFTQELEVCQEMAKLLLVKAQRLKQQLISASR